MDLTQKHICQITGLTPRQVLYYTERGLITASVEETPGRGHYRVYGLYNLFEFYVLKEFISHGVGIGKLWSIMDQLRAYIFKGRHDKSVFKLDFLGYGLCMFVKNDGSCFFSHHKDGLPIGDFFNSNSYIVIYLWKIKDDISILLEPLS